MVLAEKLPAHPPEKAPKKDDWVMFCDSVHVRGLDNALALIPPERRTAYRDHIDQGHRLVATEYDLGAMGVDAFIPRLHTEVGNSWDHFHE